MIKTLKDRGDETDAVWWAREWVCKLNASGLLAFTARLHF